MVNYDKSVVFFSTNSIDVMKDDVKEMLRIDNKALAEKYLGLPTALGRNVKGAFEYMPTKVKGLVGSWTGREASCAGREVLLKSSSYPYIPYELLSYPKEQLQEDEDYYCQLLVGHLN
ncbi:hypothetical protein PR202_ga06670 [Eleusine coracana subsp. coracana]|uniref:Uncharacterized protein n=1 Tax=Eleusine coracana subsp. coracana TaxID=191504 RepID=A0AAV5BXT4_ELECO|nr:hypothetical protein PR202_ga06670 [Eleusine coracana subsp. coracana]